MKKKVFIITFIIMFIIIYSVHSKEITKIIYQPPESTDDIRNLYHWELLQKALDKTEKKYGPAKLIPAKIVMNELRIFKKLISGSSDIDVMLRPSSIEDENLLEPVRIPLDKGLLGYRIFLIHKKNQNMFSKIKNLDQLKKLTAGQGRDWNDVKIYEYNNFDIITGSVYEGLFEMLIKGRFDYFPRGVLEAYPEYNERKDKMKDLHVEETIVLYYPFPRYFWFANNGKGKKLTKRVTEGLELMIKDGSFNRIFNKYYEEELRKANLKNRKIFRIKNPFITDSTPLNRPELWYNPFE